MESFKILPILGISFSNRDSRLAEFFISYATRIGGIEECQMATQ